MAAPESAELTTAAEVVEWVTCNAPDASAPRNA
jgi:hypothetical protein